MAINKLVLIRHGESKWNKENRFTGWSDIDLSEKGYAEAKTAGKILKLAGYSFDFSYTSMLKRAIHSLWGILDELDQAWLSVEKSWRLNERHYGALQGLSKLETAEKYGNEQVKKWRRSFTVTPPKITCEDERFPGHDVRYTDVCTNELPTGESLKLTFDRILPFWEKTIFPHISAGKRIIIVAHGNSIRVIVKILDNVSEQSISELNIPTAVPIIYEFDDNMKPCDCYFLIYSDKVSKKPLLI
ncbi:2,3-diphosphoglycerate-dependent phosphoglycerate mutase [Sodalis sp. CWE]|uniref:2,3-diphosphoglycerate-dependent phosphoglycerate mutase n=1 Tax=Sodalis sp. CWE TaxID=2803816 RepID=UPI001C7CB4D3|nr:2,3-diphosphoglycerate-dependent phosphoglycerate mutase [Sodalis sp. CWE]MBX4180936.1 2,3-diphosphoglycerate-dependent phosphoglycerate mutase [Sodalis sp. CWE]